MQHLEMSTSRLEAFSDGVIAIIITIMVLELKVPHDHNPASLLKLWPIFMSYALSFLMVAVYWINHHHLFHLVKAVNSRILWANNLLLFFLSLIPFFTAYMNEHERNEFSVAMYSGILLICAVAFSILRVSIRSQLKENPELQFRIAAATNKNGIAVVLYLFALGFVMISPPISLLLNLIVGLMYAIPDFYLKYKS